MNFTDTSYDYAVPVNAAREAGLCSLMMPEIRGTVERSVGMDIRLVLLAR